VPAKELALALSESLIRLSELSFPNTVVTLVVFQEVVVPLYQLGGVVENHAKTILLPLHFGTFWDKQLAESLDIFVVRLPLVQKSVRRPRILRWFGTPALPRATVWPF